MKKFLLIIGIIMLTLGPCAAASTKDAALNKTLVEIGRLTNAQKYHDALTVVNEAIKQFPNNAELYNSRGMILLFLDSPNAAMVDINKALAISPNVDSSYVSRGMCKYDLGDYKGALSDFNKAIELNPKNDSAYSMRGIVRLNDGDFDGADADFKLSNKLSEENLKQLETKH